MHKRFSFIYPITQCRSDSHRREGFRYDHIGDWMVNGVAYKTPGSAEYPDRLEYKIDEIVYNDTDINSMLETVDVLKNVNAACLNHIQNLFDDEEPNTEIHLTPKIGNILAKIISLPLRRKVNY